MEKIYYAHFDSPILKKVFVASTKKGVCRVDFLTSEKGFLRKLKKEFPGEVIKDHKMNQKVLSQLKKYLGGELRRFHCTFDLRGTPFQKDVWSALGKIPYGQTKSYKDLAERVGRPKAFRAVGNANGSNPLPLILPCHRVIENNGGLGGFGHGLKIKRQLLKLEKVHGI
jgi:O-6-methylguanine DNA methyltransferase